MDKDQEIAALQRQLEVGFEEQVQRGEERLASIQAVISSSVREMLSVFSNDIRNLGIVAGTVAPFSLTLLGVDSLNLYVPALIVGFSLLLLAIGLTQYFLYILSKAYDKRLRGAEVSWLFAQIGLWEMADKNNDTAKRTVGMFDYHKRIREAEKSLESKTLNPEVLSLRRKLSSYNLIAFLFVTAGLGLILGSVILNPISDYLLLFFQYLL